MGRRPQPIKTKRLSIRLNEHAVDRIGRLQARSQASSASEVIRRALAAMEMLLDAQGASRSVSILDGDGNRRELMLDF